MSRTKKYYAQQLLNVLYPNPTPDAKMDLDTAASLLSQATSEYVRNTILQNKLETRTVDGAWLSEFHNVPIKYDEVTCQYYTDLPVSVISFVEGLGVYQVWFKGRPANLLIPVSTGHLWKYRYSAAQQLQGDYGYYLLEDRIFFIQKMNTEECLSMLLIPNHSELGDMDYFPIDESCLPMIMQRALEIGGIQKQIPEDLTTNGVSD